MCLRYTMYDNKINIENNQRVLPKTIIVMNFQRSPQWTTESELKANMANGGAIAAHSQILMYKIHFYEWNTISNSKANGIQPIHFIFHFHAISLKRDTHFTMCTVELPGQLQSKRHGSFHRRNSTNSLISLRLCFISSWLRDRNTF